MTGYTVHTGATEQFVAGWDQIFKKSGKAKKTPAKKKAAVKKKAARKVAKSKGRKAVKKKK
jgi:hypothetical protein